MAEREGWQDTEVGVGEMSELKINGFTFTEDEIQSVTIRRNGEDVTLTRPDQVSNSPIVGFAGGASTSANAVCARKTVGPKPEPPKNMILREDKDPRTHARYE